MEIRYFTDQDLKRLVVPGRISHKGNNGKILVIGGSRLFHASIFWTANVASRIVDLVHFCSPAFENNEIVRRKAKEKMWDGIVVEWKDVEKYIEEDDVIVIGPGMPRPEGLGVGERSTAEIVNELLVKFPGKKWLVDGGALQECDPGLLGNNCIVTPHKGELKRLVDKMQSNFLSTNFDVINNDQMSERVEYVSKVSWELGGVTVLSKMTVDVICRENECFVVEGGNEGLTKGGTGDVLAGVAAGLWCKNDPVLASASASWVLKRAAENLYEKVGRYYNTSDLVDEIPKLMGKYFSK